MKNKILFIFPRCKPMSNLLEDPGDGAPLQLLSLASVLKQSGYQSIILDQRMVSDSEFENKIKEIAPESILVGISAMTGFQISGGIDASKFVKEVSKNTPVVWGGDHVTAMPDQALRESYIDYVVRGAGENTIVPLVKSIEENKIPENVQGVSYRKGSVTIHNKDSTPEDINHYPPFAYDLVDLEEYIDKDSERTLYYVSSRGCVKRCSFCALVNIQLRGWRAYTPERTVDEIESLVKKHDIKLVSLNDPNFFIDPIRVKAICREIIKRNLKIEWMTSGFHGQMIHFDDETWELMRDSGCRLILMGAESGSQRVLDLIKKDCKVQDIITFTEKCHKYGIRVRASFMTGFPNEPFEEFVKTIDVMDQIFKINPQNEIKLFFFTPYPNTGMWDLALKNKMDFPHKLEDWAYWSLDTWKNPWITKKHAERISFISKYCYWVAHPPKEMEESIRRKGILLRTAFKIANVTGQWRWKNRYFDLPFEKKILDYARESGILKKLLA
jgi:anaerobic magnesium-protoporphyrin IX monomethyl ester cyclase